MRSSNLFPAELRSEYDQDVLDARQRIAKAEQMRGALGETGLWQPPTSILDVGCGSALLLGALNAPNVRRVGCDMRVEPFLQSGPDRGQIAFVQADVACLPFRNGGFDLVICLAVIQEIHDWRAAIQEMARCVAPGGELYITMTNGKSLLPIYTLIGKLGMRIEESWWHYAKSSLRFADYSVANGFGLDALRSWRYMSITPHLARLRFPFLRLVPLPLLSWLLKFTATSFGHMWQRPCENEESK